ncbi:MAG: hypothetical protein HC836_40000 [Richelia sp. RM2_1_2]|nr:hypothetical protein [Richelia sp. RM2_1_2]
MNKPSSEYILDISKEYSIYVCSQRAIASICDGLKDVQRKSIWLLRNKSDKIKTISLAGELISSGIYVHGDASASGAISMLAAPYANNVPLLDGIGTFGTRVAPNEYAAPRYTYVKKSKTVEKFLLNDLEIVPLKDNYDGSVKEPVHFLPLIPTILLNGVSGIAVGWSTEILPRTFKDLVQATLDALDGKTLKKLKPSYSYLTVDVVHIEGNTWEFSGKASVVDSSTIGITELPPAMALEHIKARLDKMEEDGAINSYVDRSTETIDIKVKLARGSVKGWTAAQCVDFLKLRSKKTERIVVIDWNGTSIRQYETAEEVVQAFVEWRLGWYKIRYEKLLADDEYEIQYWRAVKLCFDNDLPKGLGKIKDKQAIEDKVKNITKTLDIDVKQLDKIVSLPTYRWAQDYYLVVLEKIKELEENIALYTAVLADESLRRAIYRDELVELRKLGI